MGHQSVCLLIRSKEKAILGVRGTRKPLMRAITNIISVVGVSARSLPIILECPGT